MNIEKTKQYYDHLTDADICDCEYCQNYVREVRAAYPELTDHLREIGVDIEKPFEAIPIGPADGVMYYSGAQYVVMGTADDFSETSVGDVRIFITDSHPMTDIEEDHFVIEISPIRLNWRKTAARKETGETMIIRSAVPEDSGDILKIYAPYVEKTAISFEYDVPSQDKFRSRVEGILAEYPYLVAQEDGEIVGYAYASHFKPRKAYDHVAEVSIYIEENHKGKGIGRALYEELERQLISRNVFVAYACITDTERPDDEYQTDDSKNFHTKMGYRLVGRHELCGYKFGRWYSMIWMEKVLAPRPEHPEEF